MKRKILDSHELGDGKRIEMYKGSFPGSRKKYGVIIFNPQPNKPPQTFDLMNKAEAEEVYTNQIRLNMFDYFLN